MRRTPADITTELPSGEPISRRDRWRAAVYLATTLGMISLVILAVVFDQIAATGVLIVAFLSFVCAYLIGPAVERLRFSLAPQRRGRPLSRSLAVLVIYGFVTIVILPVWTFNGARVGAAMERMTVLVPGHTARFVRQLHESERWHEGLGLPAVIDNPVRSLTRRATDNVEAEARKLAGELAGSRRLVPWLTLVPVTAFVLLTRWHRFRRSTTRALPTPHLQWRGNEWLRNLNSLLAAYTRAQVMSACIVGVFCWIGFAAIGLSDPGTLGLAAGLLEMVPLAGPLVLAVVATATAQGQVAAILLFLIGLRLVQDYVIYPRLISRALHLHPVSVVLALWVGAGLGGIVGVCLAVPLVGMMQVTRRHWREYRELEQLVESTRTKQESAG